MWKLFFLQLVRKFLMCRTLVSSCFVSPWVLLLVVTPSFCTHNKGQKQPQSKPRVSLSRVPLMLLHQETTSWFVPPEWGDRPQRGISPPPLPQPTRPCGSNLWSLTTSTTSMYPWSLCAPSTWTPPHHLTRVMVRSSDRSGVWVQTHCSILSAVLEAPFVHVDTHKHAVFRSFSDMFLFDSKVLVLSWGPDLLWRVRWIQLDQQNTLSRRWMLTARCCFIVTAVLLCLISSN